MSVGAVLAATIPPDADGFSGRPSAPGRCDFGRIGLAPLSQYLHLGDTSLNVILFVPLGLAIGLLGRSPATARVLVAVLALRWPSKPSNRWRRCSDAGARAGMSSTTSSGLASVSRWGCCCQSFERAGPGAEALGAPRQDPTHEVGARPSATSCVVTGNATETSRSIKRFRRWHPASADISGLQVVKPPLARGVPRRCVRHGGRGGAGNREGCRRGGCRGRVGLDGGGRQRRGVDRRGRVHQGW